MPMLTPKSLLQSLPKSAKTFFISAFSFTLLTTPLSAAWVIKDGWIADADTVATLPCEDHWTLGLQAMDAKNWREACLQFNIVAKNFPNNPMGQDACFFLGVAWMNMNELDFANDSFTAYLKCKNNPPYFLEAINYKFEIAEAFRCGAKRRILNTKQLPKWGDSTKLALQIYDEVIAAMPCHELAAQALYSKGQMHWVNKQYRESIECFQAITKRFPKNPLAPNSYIIINKIYLDQCQNEFQNPDILAFAQINMKRFKQEFPREERLEQAEYDVMCIKEVYAKGLYETGQFYERTHHSHASVIYYSNAIIQFPDTQVAGYCRERLMCLGVDPSQYEKKEEVEVETQSELTKDVIEEKPENSQPS